MEKEDVAPLNTTNGELDEETLRRNRERLFGGAKKKTKVPPASPYVYLYYVDIAILASLYAPRFLGFLTRKGTP